MNRYINDNRFSSTNNEHDIVII